MSGAGSRLHTAIATEVVVDHADRHAAGLTALRTALAELLGSSAARLEIAHTEEGAPFVVREPGLFVSISHTRDRAWAVASRVARW